MLAYTHFTQLFYAPTPLEAAVFLTGFIMVLTLPSVVFDIADRRSERKSKHIHKAGNISNVSNASKS